MTLVLVVLNVATVVCDRHGDSESKPFSVVGQSTYAFIIGSVITAWATAGGAISGGAFNPAVGMLPMAFEYYDDMWIYWVGPMFGAFLAVLVFMLTNPCESTAFGMKAKEYSEGAQRFAAVLNEFIGTMLFCTVISLIAGAQSASPLAGLAIGSMLMVIVFMGGHISGGKYNPAVSVACFLRDCLKQDKDIGGGLLTLCLDILSQGAGAMAAAGIALAITDGSKVIHYGYPAFGKSYLGSDLSKHHDFYGFWTCFWVEMIGSTLLCASVLQSACLRKTAGNGYYGIAIGFSVVVSIYSFGGISGGCFNPAVGLLNTLSGDIAGHSWDIACYWSAPFAGAVLSILMFLGFNSAADISDVSEESDDWGEEKTKLIEPESKV